MKNSKTKIPRFKNEDQEREFWATHSPLDYFDASHPQKGSFPNLKPSLKSVSIRLPEDMLIELKNLANKKDVPYQSLVKIFLAKQIALERDYSSSSLKKRPNKMVSQFDNNNLNEDPKDEFWYNNRSDDDLITRMRSKQLEQVKD